jgi:multicomponent Na+:H+ antiporter subunit G
MTATVFAIIVLALLACGVGFMLVAAVGFLRLPDAFCRLHVTGILDTLGAPLVLLAAAIWAGPTLTAGKLVLGLLFLLTTSPLVGHLLSRAALRARTRSIAVPPGEQNAGPDMPPEGREAVAPAPPADKPEVAT